MVSDRSQSCLELSLKLARKMNYDRSLCSNPGKKCDHDGIDVGRANPVDQPDRRESREPGTSRDANQRVDLDFCAETDRHYPGAAALRLVDASTIGNFHSRAFYKPAQPRSLSCDRSNELC